VGLQLQDYLYRTQRFLRDPFATGYDIPFLTYCINQARADLIYSSRCSRALALVNTVAAQESYNFNKVLSSVQNLGAPAKSILTVLGITIQYSSTPLRIALEYLPWQQFNAIYRSFPIQIYPTIWSQFDTGFFQSFYVAPIPSQVYVLEVDCIWLPSDLANPTDQETTIPQPWSDVVPLCACYWAKLYEQSMEEADWFADTARKQFNIRVGATPPWRVPSRYGSSFTS
jgi:hypothetical protein